MRKKSKKFEDFENDRQFLGVDVILNDIPNNPQCSHGPSILFKQNLSNGEEKEFFSCSACRDRKRCPFYIESDALKSLKKPNLYTNISNNYSLVRHKQCYDELHGSKTKKELQEFCATCTCYFEAVDGKNHEECLKFSEIDEDLRLQPSKFLKPREDPKCEAQYLFSDETVGDIVNFVKRLKSSKVLCIGSPRIHEKLLLEHDQPISATLNKRFQSLLLDFDERFMHFFPTENFIYYNLFNHHFFGGDPAKKVFRDFLKGPGDDIIVIMDPPFGGRMELIGNTLRTIEKEWREVNELPDTKSLPTMLVFPYFLEKAVKNSLTDFTMLDYMVDYDNHPLYTKGGSKSMKHGSAVRIFTNLEANKFPLDEDLYKLCDDCDRWVYLANNHCDVCQGCMGKDGRTYKHCKECAKCVKPSWAHCKRCNTCQQQDHKCKPSEKSKRDGKQGGCWVCKGDDHKMTNCPQRKRKASKEPSKKVKKMCLNSTEEKSRNLDIINNLLSQS